MASRRAPKTDQAATQTASGPRVSCIIIFLNEERFLGEAIESVLAQSSTDWELLLVDDGSTDGSEAIARRYCAAHGGKIFYLTHEGRANRGMSATRNLGLSHARGEFIAFLDGDDLWRADKLARQIELFERHPTAGMVCGATQYWHSWNPDSSTPDRVVHTGEADGATLEQDRLYQPPDLMLLLYPLGAGATPSASGYMITRELVSRVGGFEDSFRGLFEDQVFRAKAYLGGPIFVSAQCFDLYRQHAESCVQQSRASGTNVAAKMRYLSWLKTYLDDQGIRDRTIRRALFLRSMRERRPGLYRILRSVVRLGRG